jgi:homoserine O-acetyltransferase
VNETADSASVGVVRTQVLRIDLPPEGLALEGGERLPELHVAFETYGDLSPARDNAIFVCHALSGDAHAAGVDEDDPEHGAWWDEMIGPGKGIDTRYYHVICANVLGGCRGTTGPSSNDPRTGRPYGSTFPRISVGDIVEVHRMLLRQLGIERLAAVVGGSFGGMQVLEWVIRHPGMIDHAVCIASAASLSAQALAFDAVGRRSIMSDPDWHGGDYYARGVLPRRGLSQARQIGHITYLSPEMMTFKFGRERRPDDAPGGGAGRFDSDFQVERYLAYQGEKFIRRFDANSYLHITRAMDDFDLAERFGSLAKAFEGVRAKMLVVALSSDWLFPPEQSSAVANALIGEGKRVSICLLAAPHGHDAFLVDIEHLSEALRAFLPWVHGPRTLAAPGRADARHARRRTRRRQDFEVMAEWIEPGSRVLDLGCGDGELLTLLAERRGTSGVGVDIEIDKVVKALDAGHDVLQADIDRGLSMIPDRSFDYAILSETIQVVRRPRLVMREMLRIARRGIISFPNFGKLSHRVRLLLRGRMPLGGSLPFEWYDTPNIHFLTRKDFVDLCRRDHVRIMDTVCFPDSLAGRWLVRWGSCNLGADRVLVKVAAEQEAQAGDDTGASCRRFAGRRGHGSWRSP